MLGVLNSSLLWWFLWNSTLHGKDDVLRLKTNRMENLPIATPSPSVAGQIEHRVGVAIDLTKQRQSKEDCLRSWFEREFGKAVSLRNLESYWGLEDKEFSERVKSVSRSVPPLLGGSEIERRFQQTREVVRDLQRKLLAEDVGLQSAVFDLYGLTPEEVRLVRETAPPRDPLTLAEEELVKLAGT
jgi:hypothetical protein